MTIDKAIEILTLMGTPEFTAHTEDILAARALGIEALILCSRLEQLADGTNIRLLPSETEK